MSIDISVVVETEVFEGGTVLEIGQDFLEILPEAENQEPRRSRYPEEKQEAEADVLEDRLGLNIVKLLSLMQEQTAVLRRIDQRQAAADLSQKAIPEVSATNSGTWSALLRSTVAGTIQPRVDKWHSILNTLFIFVALFSAIVAAFLVPSLTGLQQDKVDRTNELLANLTEILIELSAGANRATLNITSPEIFQPDAMSVRLTSYWSVSLILCLLVAVLAVTCRGWLNLVALSHHPNSMDKLVDIQTRWKAAEKMLGPVIELTPQLLIIPVLLFVVGLLDNIFSDVLALSTWPSPIIAALGLSLIFLTGIGVFLGFALIHAVVLRDHSPFQSALAHILRSMCRGVSRTFPVFSSKDNTADIIVNPSSEHQQVCSVYHEIVQATHDDETLDKAAAALSSVIDYRSLPYDPHVKDEECDTLLHLLSPEASIRSNYTAAQTIVHLNEGYSRFLSFPTRGSASIMLALTHAARRSVNGLSLTTLWTSPFLRAMAIVAKACHEPHPPVACILGSRYVRYPDSTVLNLLFDVFEQMFPTSTLNNTPPPAAIELFKPDFIRARDVLESLHHLSEVQLARKENIISLLIAAKTPAIVVGAAHELLESVNFSFLTTYTTIGLIIKVYHEQPAFAEEQLLGNLCVACVLSLKDHIDVVGAALFNFFTPFLEVVQAAMSKLPPNHASLVLAALMANRGHSIGKRRIARYEAEQLFPDAPLDWSMPDDRRTI
ncbi:hypothetical protein FB451DRAFT_306638 [Mycena latifolia]|nr:hypothetical protein FB451DRAFT_306638 [Mycena latifolia]